MKTLTKITIAAGVALTAVAFGASVRADGAPATQGAAPIQIAQAMSITYTPPFRGAPSRRIGGSSRSTGEISAKLVVLAAEDVGLTMQAQPTLYWYLSETVDRPVELVMVDPDAIDPVLTARIKGPVTQGVHALDLAGMGVTLKADVDYEWSVAIVVDPNSRARDVVSSGVIRRVAPPSGVANANGAPGEKAARYAQAGLWYDAIGTLSAAIAKAPGDAGLREMRTSLLGQVGLGQVGE